MQLDRIDQFRYRIPPDAVHGMRSECIVYASPTLLDQIRNDTSLNQAVNVSMLPGIVGPSLAMPDIHQGYGFPIGGVAPTDWQHGVVSPGGVGFDINCGVRLMRTSIEADEVRPKLRELVNQIFRDIPCGTGGAGPIELKPPELDAVLVSGSRWLIEQGFGEPADAEVTKERGRGQLGTIGSGNHFLEIQFVQQIHDEEAARAMGLRADQVVVLVHCG